MTHQQLHSLSLKTDKKDLVFSDLSSDPRIAGLINALRRNQPVSAGGDAHHVIRDAGRGEGWKECVDEMERLILPPKVHEEKTRPPAYSKTIRVPRENISGFDANNIS